MEGSPQDPRFVAAIDLVRRTGSREFQIRYSDDEEPTVWMAVAKYGVGGDGQPKPKGGRVTYEAAGAIDPLTAVMRLAEQLVDGAQCAHCHRPTGVSDDWRDRMPLEEHICWYIYDPELQRFRRSCEGGL